MTFRARFSTLQAIFDHATTNYAKRPLFGTKCDGQWVWTTYEAFGEQVATLRSALDGLRVGKGDRVAFIADNRVEWAVANYATTSLGGQFVPMYEAQLAKDWAYILRDCGAKVLFVANDDIAKRIEAHRADLPDLAHLVVLDTTQTSPSWAELMAQGAARVVPPSPVEPEDVAGFIYTSGTTGDPKGVLLTHGNLARNVSAAKEVFPIEPEDRSLSFLPWAHSFGQTAELHTLFASGASMGLAEAVPKIVDNLSEVRPTILISVPRIFNRIHDSLHQRMNEAGGVRRWLFDTALANARRRRELAARGQQDWKVEFLFALFDRVVFSQVRDRFGGRLEYAISGGAALSPKVAEFIDDIGIVVFEGYGLTETSPVVAANAPDAIRIGTVGKPFPGVRIELDHEVTGDPVDGEIIVYGHCVMKGYHGLPEQNAQVFTADGGFRTGDMGRFDEDGFLSITGRIKEQYKLENGKYVVPTPLEEQLKLAPLVANALVFGHNKPHNIALIVPDWDAVALWARKQGVEHADARELLDHPALREAIQAQLATQTEEFKHYERPKDFAIIPEDFTTENGMLTPSMKVKRRVVITRHHDTIQALYA